MKFDFNSILSIVGIIGYFICFFILKQTIKSKNSVIEDLKVLMGTTDIKRLAEYQTHLDGLRKKEIGLIIAEEARNFKLEFHGEVQMQYDEMATFIDDFLKAMPTETRELLISRDMPHCRPMFQEALDYPEPIADNNAQTDSGQ